MLAGGLMHRSKMEILHSITSSARAANYPAR
jgi:hypothetical protein